MDQDPVAVLRARNLRVTPQRRAILAAFTNRPEEHLSADEVHARASAQIPELGRGTVYAALAELTELGALAALGSPEPVRYERNVTPHQHFRCRLCTRLFDVDLPAMSRKGLSRQGYVVEQISVMADGVCAECTEYQRGLLQGIADVRESPQLGAATIAKLACARHEGPLGSLVLAASTEGMVRIAFEEHADFEPLAARAGARRGASAARATVNRASAALDAYFEGDRHEPGDMVDWAAVGSASTSSLQATQAIPYAERRSYQRLTLEDSSYACGYSMGANPVPVLLPCHRVVRGTETPDDYVGGPERRRLLTALEERA